MDLNILLAGEVSGEYGSLTPLTPEGVGFLNSRLPLKIMVEASSKRVFRDEEYALSIKGDNLLEGETWVLGVNPIDPDRVRNKAWYFLSSRGLKQGWSGETRLLDRMKAQGCTLVDLELLASEQKNAPFSWAHFVGMMGMAESLFVLGQKMKLGGMESPLDELKTLAEHTSIVDLQKNLESVGDRVSEEGIPEQICPLVISILGGGAFQTGIDSVLELFPLKTFSPHVVDENMETFSGDVYSIYKVVFREEDLFEKPGTLFDPSHVHEKSNQVIHSPDRFLSFSPLVISSVYPSANLVSLLNREYLKSASFLNSNPYPRVVTDLTGIPGTPLSLVDESGVPFGRTCTYLGRKDLFVDGIDASGTTVFSLSQIPPGLAREASGFYSSRLSVLLLDLLRLKMASGKDSSWIPQQLRRSMILDRGHQVVNRL